MDKAVKHRKAQLPAQGTCTRSYMVKESSWDWNPHSLSLEPCLSHCVNSHSVEMKILTWKNRARGEEKNCAGWSRDVKGELYYRKSLRY